MVLCYESVPVKETLRYIGYNPLLINFAPKSCSFPGMTRTIVPTGSGLVILCSLVVKCVLR